jgi:hypothetical protein
MKILPRHVFVIALFILIFTATLRPVADPDFWWHLQTGKLILNSGAIPHADPFSYSAAGKEWVTHEWLTEIIMYLLYGKLGMIPLIVFFSLVITAAYLFAYLRTADAAKPYAAGFVLILCAVASAPLWGARPQMISLLLTSVFLYFLDEYEKNQSIRSLIPLPLLTVIWVNLHGGFIIGIGIIGVYLVGFAAKVLLTAKGKAGKSAWKPTLILAGTIGTCLLASLINPNTYKLLIYPFQTLFDPAMQQYLVEWYSPDFHNMIWVPFAVLVLALIAAGMAGKSSVSISRMLLVVVFGFAAFRSVRHIPLFAIAAAPVLAEQIGQIIKIPSSKKSGSRAFQWLNVSIVLALAVYAALTISQLPVKQEAKDSETFPRKAADWMIANRPEGKMFNSYTWGGYLIWKLYPQYPVYIDGRADVHGADFIRNYARIYQAQSGWEEDLENTGARIVLIENDSLLTKALRESKGWQILYEDEQSIIFYIKSCDCSL